MRVFLVTLTLASILGSLAGCMPLPLVASPPLTLLSTGTHDGVEISGSIEVRFNQPLPADIDIRVQPATPIEFSLSDTGEVLSVQARDLWDYGTDYTLTVGDISVNFSTRPVPEATVFVGGDILLDKRPGENIVALGPEHVFAGLRGILDAADLRFANLENPVSLRGEPVQKNFRFRSPPETLDALSVAGFDVLSFANNHTFDYGEEAFLDTLKYLDERDIRYVGVGRDRDEALSPVIVSVDGVRIAFLAFMQRTILPVWSPPLWEAGTDKSGVVFLDGDAGRKTIIAAVQAAQSEADVVLVSLHWGVEGLRAPQDWQRNLAKAILDSGAHAILGHHPHLPFGIEDYEGKPIIYSMGNLLFHPYDPEARESFVVILTLGLTGVRQTVVHPILMGDGRTEALQGESADSVLQLIKARSAALGTELVRRGDTLVLSVED